jgi:mono/diheme cytochrome c family protein
VVLGTREEQKFVTLASRERGLLMRTIKIPPTFPSQRNLRPTLSIKFIFLGLALVSCGGNAPEPAAPSATNNASPANEATPAQDVPIKWSETLSTTQKIQFMKQSVLPKMSQVFQASDRERYSGFSCKTCHGPNNKDPKEFLPNLTMKEGNLTAFTEKPTVAKFMHEKVVPEMAALFEQKPYDPSTHQGFGCAGCHKIEMK